MTYLISKDKKRVAHIDDDESHCYRVTSHGVYRYIGTTELEDDAAAWIAREKKIAMYDNIDVFFVPRTITISGIV